MLILHIFPLKMKLPNFLISDQVRKPRVVSVMSSERVGHRNNKLRVPVSDEETLLLRF